MVSTVLTLAPHLASSLTGAVGHIISFWPPHLCRAVASPIGRFACCRPSGGGFPVMLPAVVASHLPAAVACRVPPQPFPILSGVLSWVRVGL